MNSFIYDTYNAFVLDRIGWGTRVLDVGCATGRLAEALASKECTCTGLEGNPRSAERALAYCSGGVHVVDLDDTGALGQLQLPGFDYIVFADVLEHLRRPVDTLRLLMRFLAPGGVVLCSIPNIAYWRKRLMLLRGDWNYEESGICDRTHLRFFTESTAVELIREADLAVDDIFYQGLDGKLPAVKRRFPRLFATGFVVRASRRHGAEGSEAP